MTVIMIPPTRSNLRKTRNDLALAREGFGLLEQKREILVMEIVKDINRIKGVEEKLRNALEDFYGKFRMAAVQSGTETMARKSLSEKERYTLSFEYPRVLGVELSELSCSVSELEYSSGFWGTGAYYDKTKESGNKLLHLLAEYATAYKTIFLLSRELKKVQRKVNALEKILIPDYEKTAKYIAERLEEMDREEFSIKKMIKEQKGQVV